MDVIGIDIVLITQGLHAFLQALERQAVRRIDARSTEDRDTNSVLRSEATQLPFGINPASGADRGRIKPAGLVDTLTGAVAVDSGGANVDQPLW